MNLRSKKAYPNYEENIGFTPPRDTQKWINLTTLLYAEMHRGEPRKDVINRITGDMDKMEKIDFLNWLKFYEENSHKKYSSEKAGYTKSAQSTNYYMSDDGVYLPGEVIYGGQDNGGEMMHSETTSVDRAMSKTDNDKIVEESNRKALEDHKKKILARIHAAKKLAGSALGVQLLGDEYNGVIQALLDLERDILSVKKKASSNKIYKDLIIRKANQLMSHGFTNSHGLLVKVADTLPPPPAPPAPTDNVGIPGVMTTNPIPGGMAGFISGMNDGGVAAGMGVGDTSFAEDDVIWDDVTDEGDEDGISNVTDEADFFEVTDDDTFEEEPESQDGEDLDNPENNFDNFEESLYVSDGKFGKHSNEDIIVIEAQAAPVENALPAQATPPTNSAEPVKPGTEELDVKEDTESDDSPSDGFDSYIDKAFENLSVNDVINKLNDLVKVFRTREIPRQLSIIDMMLDRLGLSTYFPSLAEATNKSLESNQYILSRIEDVTSRLQGSLEAEHVDLSAMNPPETSDAGALKVKQDLEQKSQKEKERKRVKKEMEEKALDEASDQSAPKENSNIEVKEDMAGPVSTTTEMPQAAQPPAAKPAAQPVA